MRRSEPGVSVGRGVGVPGTGVSAGMGVVVIGETVSVSVGISEGEGVIEGAGIPEVSDETTVGVNKGFA